MSKKQKRKGNSSRATVRRLAEDFGTKLRQEIARTPLPPPPKNARDFEGSMIWPRKR